jgi:uncharacterized protein YndB with AHSA1/START domain
MGLAMAGVERNLAAGREAVWAVLADPARYPDWVLGMSEVRRADRDWPLPGATFDYRLRWGPVPLAGRATVLAAHPPGHLRIRWRRGLVGESTVELTIHRDDGTTTIRMSEGRAGLFQGIPANPLIAAIDYGRDVTSIDRLRRLVHNEETHIRRQT